MQRLTFINAKGQDITFAEYAPFVFYKIAGLEYPIVEPVSTQASGQHGYTLHDVLLEGRKVTLTAHIHGENGVRQMYEKRRELNRVCNPLLGVGKLVYQNDYGSWSIPAYGKANAYGSKVREFQTLDVEFSCPTVFWRTAEPMQANLAYIDGGLEFPLETPSYFGYNSYYAEVDNDGDAEAHMEIYMDGGAVNPVITNLTTGEFIRLDKFLHSYEKLYICTDPENIEVSLISVDPATNEPVRENAFGYLSDDSTLFRFQPGVNRLMFESEDNNLTVRIRFMFYFNYLGV